MALIDPRLFDQRTFAPQVPAFGMLGDMLPGGPLGTVGSVVAPEAPMGWLRVPQSAGFSPMPAAPVTQEMSAQPVQQPASAPLSLAPPAPAARQESPGFFGGLNNALANNSNMFLGMGAGLMSGDWADGFKGAMVGGKLDREQRAENLTEKALIGRGIAPDMARIAARNPALLQSILSQSLKNNRPLSADEKSTLGLPANLPWFVGSDNKPFLPEGLSQAKPEVSKDAAGNPIIVNPWQGDGRPVSGITPQPKFDDVSGLRKEATNSAGYKRYQEAAPIFNSMVKSFGNKTRASDLDFVYGMAKIFDPESVVREGEMVIVNKAQSLPSSIVGAINRLNGGEQLQEETRRALLGVSETRMREYSAQARMDVERYKGIAERNRMNPSDVLPSMTPLAPLPAPPANPPANIGAMSPTQQMQQAPDGSTGRIGDRPVRKRNGRWEYIQ